MPHNRVRGFEKDFSEWVHLVDCWLGRLATCSHPNQAILVFAILFRFSTALYDALAVFYG